MTSTEKLIQEVLDEKAPIPTIGANATTTWVRNILREALESLAAKMRAEQV